MTTLHFYPIDAAGHRRTVGVSSELVGDVWVHPSPSLRGGYSSDRWSVSGLDGVRLRGGFLTYAMAVSWAAASTEAQPKAGDEDLFERLTAEPSATVGNAYDVGVAGLWRWCTAVGPKLRDRALSEARAVLTGLPMPKRTGSLRQCVAVNIITGQKRGFTYTVENLLRRGIRDADDECTGACRCRIEQDGSCPKGWPSRSVAASLI